MPRYYFDLREGGEFVPDDEGMELSSMHAVQEEAARSLVDLARDNVRKRINGAGERMAIEVRDRNGPVMQVKFTFEINKLKR